MFLDPFADLASRYGRTAALVGILVLALASAVVLGAVRQ